jgi:hypothetical protein
LHRQLVPTKSQDHQQTQLGLQRDEPPRAHLRKQRKRKDSVERGEKLFVQCGGEPFGAAVVEARERARCSVCRDVVRPSIVGHCGGGCRASGALPHGQRLKELTCNWGGCFVSRFGLPANRGCIVGPDGSVTLLRGAQLFGYQLLEQDRCHFQIRVGELPLLVEPNSVGWLFEAPHRRLNAIADPDASSSSRGCITGPREVRLVLHELGYMCWPTGQCQDQISKVQERGSDFTVFL